MDTTQSKRRTLAPSTSFRYRVFSGKRLFRRLVTTTREVNTLVPSLETVKCLVGEDEEWLVRRTMPMRGRPEIHFLKASASTTCLRSDGTIGATQTLDPTFNTQGSGTGTMLGKSPLLHSLIQTDSLFIGTGSKAKKYSLAKSDGRRRMVVR